MYDLSVLTSHYQCYGSTALLTPKFVGQWNQGYDLFLNQFASTTDVCIIRNIVVDFVYNVLMLNLTSDQSYKPTNVQSNVIRLTF